MSTSTSASLDQLAEDLGAVSFVGGTDATAEMGEVLDRARRLLEVKLRFETRRPESAPPLVVIAGGTNVGKSTVFNWVVGESVASSSPLARHTKAPTVYIHSEDVTALGDGAFLPSYRRLVLEEPQDAAQEGEEGIAFFLKTHARDDVRGLILVDSPDIDSTHERNRTVAEDLLFLADALVFVTTPEKYNDDLCVRYLRRATELEKAVVCVLNKGADEAVETDFREGILPELNEGKLLMIPYVTPQPDPSANTPYRDALRAAVVQPEGKALRKAATRGACLTLGRKVERITSRLRQERSELDRLRSSIDLALQTRRDEYVRFLVGLEFYELDRVFERVLAYFRIPVLDTVYESVTGAARFLGSGLTRLVTGRPTRDSRSAKLQARAETDRQKVKELVEAARAEVMELPYRQAGLLREAVPSFMESLKASGIEDVNRDVETFLSRAEAEAERWIEQETRRHVEMLEQHPYARNALRSMKGFFQIGFGLLSAHLTGGLGPWDLLIGTATERATKAIMEKVGGRVHYQKLKAGFTAQRGEIFLKCLRETVGEPLSGCLPPGVDPERLERLDTAAASLRHGEVPA